MCNNVINKLEIYCYTEMRLALVGFLLIIFALLMVSYSAAGQQSTEKSVVVVNLNQEVDPGSAHMFHSALSSVTSKNVAAVIINMNTPGGILSDMQSMVSDIQRVQDVAHVPVYTYIQPDGWGASAGSYIAIASNLTYMGPGSFIGPSTPIVVGGTSIEQNHTQNAMEQYMVALAQRNHHNATAASIMVSKNKAYNYLDANQTGLVNGISNNLSSFIQLMGLQSYKQYQVNPSAYDQLLSLLSNSVVDGTIILLGTIAILVDLSHATVVLTVLGVTLIALGLIGLEIISADIVGVVLLIIGIFLVLLEFKTGHGLALMGGVTLGIVGAFLMSPDYIASNSYNPASPYNSTNIAIAIIVIIVAGFIAFYLKYIFSSMLRRVETGVEGMLGKTGVCKTDLSPKGWIAFEGQQWKAQMVGDNKALAGDKVVIKGSDGLMLLVDKVDESNKS